MKKTFSAFLLGFFLLTAGSFQGHAVPAKQEPIQVIQEDGSTLTLIRKGDEFFHYTVSVDGRLLLRDKKGRYTYAVKDSEGKPKAGTLQAKDPAFRTAEERLTLSLLPSTFDLSLEQQQYIVQKKTRLSLPFKSAQRIAGSTKAISTLPKGLLSDYPRTGTIRSLVILVNFSDRSFQKENNRSVFDQMQNQIGYSANNHQGSVRDYYNFQSGGLFTPVFDVVGPVTVSKPMAYYGQNDANENDRRPEEMIKEACQLVDSMVDFGQYDYDKDGTVDNIYVYYAGKGEADGGADSTIWPHSYALSASNIVLKLDSMKIDNYACSAELDGYNNRTGIGTFTHEYGHILGLPDLYDVDYDTYNGQSLDVHAWSLMAYGAYNGNGAIPPCLTVLERYLLGWQQPVELNESGPKILKDLESSRQGYIIRSDDPGEYFLLENRQQAGNKWDSALPYHGMLAFHIDMRENDSLGVNYYGTPMILSCADLWSINMVNAIGSHPCADVEEADGKALLYTYNEFNGQNNYYAFTQSLKGDPFPGTSSKVSFTDRSAPSMLRWNGSGLNKPVTNIVETSDSIGFDFMDNVHFTTVPILNQPSSKSITPTSFPLSWNTVTDAAGYYLDVYTLDNKDSINYLPGYQNLRCNGTTITVSTPYDQTTHYCRIRATNNFQTTASSNVVSLTTPVNTPTTKPATNVEPFAFTANWSIADWASGVYVDVYKLDIQGSDTTWIPVENHINKYLRASSKSILELDDECTYAYCIRNTNLKVTSITSPFRFVKTAKAENILAYASDRIIYLLGADPGATIRLYRPDGKLYLSTLENRIPVSDMGIYLIEAVINGSTKRLKLFVP